MRGLLLGAIWATSAACVLQKSSPLLQRRWKNETGTPCAIVSASVAQVQAAPAAHTGATVAADLAYDCITSVPFNATAAAALVDALHPYVDWQSTTAYLKNPPASYAKLIQPPTDIHGKLANLTVDILRNKFANEYEFGLALHDIFQSAHDGHFHFTPDVLGSIFHFRRPVSLVSVSADGKDVPQVYAYDDLLTSTSNATYKPSAVTKIDSQDAVDFLLKWSQNGKCQDRDALWNEVFYSPAQSQVGTVSGSFKYANIAYTGATTSLTFANGSTSTLSNYAEVLPDFAGVSSGEDLYRKFFTYNTTVLRPASETSTSPSPTSPITTPTAIPDQCVERLPGYPRPVFCQLDHFNSGYFLEGEGFEDVAVLSVASFEGGSDSQFLNQQFLVQAKTAGKTKLIVDVSGNGGGLIALGYDLFRQLFPSIQEVGLQRFRTFEATNLISQEMSREAQNRGNASDDVIGDSFNYRFDMTEDAKSFRSWQAKFGPHKFNGDSFTSLFRWNWSDPLTSAGSLGLTVTGYQDRTNFTQPFAREDIVVLTDGFCASTCSLFSYFMRDQAGIKHFAIGGRPSLDPMQAVGGVKGSEDLEFKDVYDYIATALEYGGSNLTSLGRYNQLPMSRTARGSTAGVNFKDQLNPGDPTQTPRQFIYEPSDCRLFYTPQMIVDVSEAWRAVASIAWGKGNGTCVSGDEVFFRKTKRRSIGRVPGAKKS